MVKPSPVSAGDVRDMGSIPESGRSPGHSSIPFLTSQLHLISKFSLIFGFVFLLLYFPS